MPGAAELAAGTARADDDPGRLEGGEPGGVEAEVGLGPGCVVAVLHRPPVRQLESLNVADPLLGAAAVLGRIGAGELDGEIPGAQV